MSGDRRGDHRCERCGGQPSDGDGEPSHAPTSPQPRNREDLDRRLRELDEVDVLRCTEGVLDVGHASRRRRSCEPYDGRRLASPLGSLHDLLDARGVHRADVEQPRALLPALLQRRAMDARSQGRREVPRELALRVLPRHDLGKHRGTHTPPCPGQGARPCPPFFLYGQIPVTRDEPRRAATAHRYTKP